MLWIEAMYMNNFGGIMAEVDPCWPFFYFLATCEPLLISVFNLCNPESSHNPDSTVLLIYSITIYLWSNGRLPTCHGGDPGFTPGWHTSVFLWNVFITNSHWKSSCSIKYNIQENTITSNPFVLAGGVSSLEASLLSATPAALLYCTPSVHLVYTHFTRYTLSCYHIFFFACACHLCIYLLLE